MGNWLVASRLGHGARFASDLKAEGLHELWEPSWASLHLDRWLDVSLSWPSLLRRLDGPRPARCRLLRFPESPALVSRVWRRKDCSRPGREAFGRWRVPRAAAEGSVVRPYRGGVAAAGR